MRAIAFALLSACSPHDDCAKAAAKLQPLVEEIAHRDGELAPGQSMSDLEKDAALNKLADKCRAQNPEGPSPRMKCVLAADDEAAVRACEDRDR